MIFRQLFEQESSTYTYILADEDTKEAVIIDSVLETVERDLNYLSELSLKLKYILDTHIHADHITGAGRLRAATGAKTAVAEAAHVGCVDIQLKNEQALSFGKYSIKALSTPGHTDSCMSFFCEEKVFTGDAILIRATGRTDFQQGSPEKLFESIQTKIFSLPDSTQIFPAHDYRGFTSSTVGEEKKFNPRIGAGKSREEFIQIMRNLKLADPKKMDVAVPANLECGRKILF